MADDFDDLLDEIDPEEDAPPVAEGQVTLFGSDDDFKVAYQEWVGMPEPRPERYGDTPMSSWNRAWSSALRK